MIPEIERIADFEQALQMAAQCDTLLIPYELCDNMPESVTAVQRAAEGKSVGIFIGRSGAGGKRRLCCDFSGKADFADGDSRTCRLVGTDVSD